MPRKADNTALTPAQSAEKKAYALQRRLDRNNDQKLMRAFHAWARNTRQYPEFLEQDLQPSTGLQRPKNLQRTTRRNSERWMLSHGLFIHWPAVVKDHIVRSGWAYQSAPYWVSQVPPQIPGKSSYYRELEEMFANDFAFHGHGAKVYRAAHAHYKHEMLKKENEESDRSDYFLNDGRINEANQTAPGALPVLPPAPPAGHYAAVAQLPQPHSQPANAAPAPAPQQQAIAAPAPAQQQVIAAPAPQQPMGAAPYYQAPTMAAGNDNAAVSQQHAPAAATEQQFQGTFGPQETEISARDQDWIANGGSEQWERL